MSRLKCHFICLDLISYTSQQEEKDRETPKDSLDDLFPNDEEENGKTNSN